MTAGPKEIGDTVADEPIAKSVASTKTNGSMVLEPMTFKGESHEAMFKLIQAVEQVPRSRITGIGPDYLLVEFTNKSDKATDDLEFRMDPGLKLIHFKSFSKVGQTDRAENLQRVEEIKKVFESL